MTAVKPKTANDLEEGEIPAKELDKPPFGKGLISYDDLPDISEPSIPAALNTVSFTIKRKAISEDRIVKKRALSNSEFLIPEANGANETKDGDNDQNDKSDLEMKSSGDESDKSKEELPKVDSTSQNPKENEEKESVSSDSKSKSSSKEESKHRKKSSRRSSSRSSSRSRSRSSSRSRSKKSSKRKGRSRSRSRSRDRSSSRSRRRRRSSSRDKKKHSKRRSRSRSRSRTKKNRSRRSSSRSRSRTRRRSEERKSERSKSTSTASSPTQNTRLQEKSRSGTKSITSSSSLGAAPVKRSERSTDDTPLSSHSSSTQISPNNSDYGTELEQMQTEDFDWPDWLNYDHRVQRQTKIIREALSNPDIGKPRPLNSDELYNLEDLGDFSVPVDARKYKRGKGLLVGDGWRRHNIKSSRKVALLWSFEDSKEKPVDPRSGPNYVLLARVAL